MSLGNDNPVLWPDDSEDAAIRWWQQSPLRPDEDKHMKIGDMIESKYMKQSDVDDVVTVTIQYTKKVNVARDDEDPEYRWTAKFAEFPKPMVLNVTNLKRLAKALGDDSDDWNGKQIQLYVDPDIEFGGNVVGGLRLRGIAKPRPNVQPQKRSMDEANRQLSADMPDDIPF